MDDEALAKWKVLADKVQGIAVAMSEAADPNDKNGETFMVKVWAVALLCRTTNNFAGMRLLLSDALIVEARTLTRCIYENLFRVGYLLTKGYSAVTTWLSEHDLSNKKAGNDLLTWSKEHTAHEADEFDAFMEELNSKQIKGSGLEAQAVAAGLKTHYISYRMLSADAAHPTARVLARHARTESDGSLTISGASFWTDDDEEMETYSLSILAFILICVGVDQIVGLGFKQALDECSAECSRLHASTLT